MQKNQRLLRALLPVVLVFAWVTCAASETELPVKVPNPQTWKEVPFQGTKTFLSIDMIQAAIKSGDSRGLLLDLTEIHSLLDGTEVKPSDLIYGTVYIGPYPFEAEETAYAYKRFKIRTMTRDMKAVLAVGAFLNKGTNSENWLDEGRVVVRLDLHLASEKNLRYLGLYDTFVSFKRVKGEDGAVRFVKQTSLIEGPVVNLICSDDPSSMVISFKTDQPVPAAVVLKSGQRFPSSIPARKHEIKITGLEPDKEYTYSVSLDNMDTKAYTFHTAPKPGDGKVVFAYAGDSREGEGGGTSNYMGVNYNSLERCANLAYREGADLFVFGGDLVHGYTSVPGDFRNQVHAWRQAMAGFCHMRPVYTCIGNHEALMRVFAGGERSIVMDRWPYATESVEAVFADEMVNPRNGPEVSDGRRPTYKENVYSFQYGPVRFIAFNNNYWLGRDYWKPTDPADTGGSPEGYIMDDQLDWIRKELKSAETDRTVKYIILFAQEPVFPNGGHVQDCMWYNGNNNIRAYTYDAASGKVVPEKKGIIDIRNELALMVAENRKVAAVLGSDEHSYHKVLIDKNVPVGVPGIDDKNGDGKICQVEETCSPLTNLKYPTWYLTCGGAGAPYYSEDRTPWNMYWKNYTGTLPSHTSKRGCYYYSSQENTFVFSADQDRISVAVHNLYGEIIDTIDDLMKVKE